MRLLLDTHVWVWAAIRPERLRPEVREEIEAGSDIVVSTVVAFEVAVKQALGKLEPDPSLLALPSDHSFSTLEVSWAHAVEVGTLPFHHRDPFDRLLIAQARVEGLTIVTADQLFARYDVSLLAP